MCFLYLFLVGFFFQYDQFHWAVPLLENGYQVLQIIRHPHIHILEEEVHVRQTGDESPVGRPGSVHTGTDDIDTDLQEDEEDDYKSLEIKKGPNVYSCSLHKNLKFVSRGRNV